MSFVLPLTILLEMADMPDMPGMDHGADATQALIFNMLVASRWLHFASVFALYGSSVFWLGMGRRQAGALPAARAATLRLLRVAAPLALLTGIGWLASMIANMTGGFSQAAEPGNLRLFFFETSFGPVWAIRLGLLAAAAIFAWAPVKSELRLALLASVGALLLFSQAWLGHSAEGGTDARGVLMIAVYALHMGATGFWVGALPPLIFALAEIKTAGAADARYAAYAILLRFSGAAAIAVALIVLSGAGTTWFRTAGSFGILAHTTFGAVLFTKLVLVAAMLALAAYNRFRAMPRLNSSAAGRAWILTSIGIEIGLGLLVLAAAAVLGITPPPE